MNLKAAESIPIENIVIGARIRQFVGDIQELADSMNDVGQLVPVLVDQNDFLVDGLRRIKAAQLLQWKEIKAVRINLKSSKKGEYEANARRLQFTPSEAVVAAEAIERAERLLAAERVEKNLKVQHIKSMKEKTPEQEKYISELEKIKKGRSKDRAGEIVGMSGRTLAKAQAIVEKAKEDPEKFSDLVEKMDNKSVDSAFRELKSRLESENPNAKTPEIILRGNLVELKLLKGEHFPCREVLQFVANNINIEDGETYKITRQGFRLIVINIT